MTITALDPALVRRIIDDAEGRREEIVALSARLVAARSVNPDGDTRAVAALVVDALADFGLESVTESCADSMPSIVAEIDSGRPGPHLVLNVHVDTMPPGDESAWTVPVWSLTRRDGRLYGLGMGNMKGAVAAMLNAVDLLNRHREHWRGRVTFTAVSDEVVFGDNGAAFLLREHPHLRGDGLLCGEGPGYARLAIGEKGVLWLEITATGDDLRLPPGISAADAEKLVREHLSEHVGISVTRIKGWDSNWTSPESPLTRAWHTAAESAGLPEPRHAMRLPASDASRWRQLGVPALCYGPQPTLSAGIDDYAVEQEVIDCVSLYTLTAMAFLNGNRS